MEETQDLNIREIQPLITPLQIKADLPMSEATNRTVVEGRREIERILDKEDERLLVVAGPCSIHDRAAALEYARRLQALRQELAEHLCIVMRVYFEKPRTVVGWKGLIHDPHLDGSEDMPEGLRTARKILLEINALGLPAGTEVLDPITPQYSADLISWAAIGARTTESQTHREMASGLSMPVGFKNSTEGNLQVAINAMQAARQPHSFLGIDQEGRTCVVRTSGNSRGHLVLRGGNSGPNYHPESIEDAVAQLVEAELEPAIVVDCSHANSGKKHGHQERVWRSVLQQRLEGSRALVGLMLESNLRAGNQKMAEDPRQLDYGVSVTDECVDWQTTERLLRSSCEILSASPVGVN